MNNNEDALFTPDEMKQADHIMDEIYKKAGVTDKYKCPYYPVAHKFDAAMHEESFNRFDKLLI